MLFTREIVKGSTAMLIMSLLYSEGDLYGYQIAKMIEERSDNTLVFKEGTLYPALYKLEEDGFVQTDWRIVEGRKRKYYLLTSKGKTEFQKRRQEWSVFTNSVKKVLGDV